MPIATGTFTVTITPAAEPSVVDGVTCARMTLAKVFTGDLAGTSTGEMLSTRAPVPTSAGYVAMERVMGTLHGREGSFVLQHAAWMHDGAQDLAITVTPGSGTGGLAGLRGTFRLRIEHKVHHYELEYTLPA